MYRVKHSSSEARRRPSSLRSKLSQSDSDMLVVRTDQTPLRPPTASKNSASVGASTSSIIKVETDFVAPDPNHHLDRSETKLAGPAAVAPLRKKSFNPLPFFSTPLTLIRHASFSTRRSRTPITKAKVTPPATEDLLHVDHRSLLKRNHTSEALSHVSAILQELVHPPAGPSRQLAVIKPLRWRTFSDRWTSLIGDKDHLMVPGVNDQFAPHLRKSIDQLSDARSYTSSERNLLMGPQPNNSPAEQATYKIKRSASAETEEFLKVDISIRGGTSYLPSEARRIHTPPLPEEGMDGRWRGFFFDYNAPRGASNVPEVCAAEVAPHSGSTSPESAAGESQSMSTPFGRKGGRCKEGRRTRNVVGRDWYDVKLAELDEEMRQIRYLKMGTNRSSRTH